MDDIKYLSKKLRDEKIDSEFIGILTTSRLQDLYDKLYFDLLIGSIFEKSGNDLEIELFKISSEDRYCNRILKYHSIGCGRDFANYLLKRVYSNRIKLLEAINLAIYVIKEVKDIDNNCDGQTQVAAINKEGINFLKPNYINKLERLLTKKDTNMKKNVRSEIYES